MERLKDNTDVPEARHGTLPKTITSSKKKTRLHSTRPRKNGYHELHEDPNFASITVHEEVDDLVEVVRLLDEHYKFFLFETRSFHSTFPYFFCHDRAGTRVFESLLHNQRESALSVFPEEA